MMPLSLENVTDKGECHEGHTPTRFVTYDCGDGQFESYLVCEECWEKEANDGTRPFQRCAVRVEVLQ